MQLTGSIYLLCAKLVPQIIYHQHVDVFDAINEQKLPKVSEDDLFKKIEIFASGVRLLRFLLLNWKFGMHSLVHAFCFFQLVY
jgi:hypothetical protein